MTDKSYPVVGYSNLNGGIQGGNYSDDPTNQQLPKDNQALPFSMPIMLSWIHEEWRKIELQKVQWDLQRAEFQAQITTLQSERNGQESVKRDLIRRIKMLEFALREERKILEHLRVHPQRNSGETTVPSFNSRTTTVNDGRGNDIRSTNPKLDVTSSVYERVQKDAEEAAKASTQFKEGIKRLKQYLTEVAYNETLVDMRHVRLRHLVERKGMPVADDFPASQKRLDDIQASTRGAMNSLAEIAASEAALSNFDFLKSEMDDEENGDMNTMPQFLQNQIDSLGKGRSEKDPLMKGKKITRSSSKKGSLKEVIASLQAEYDRVESACPSSNGGVTVESASKTAPLDNIANYMNKVEADPNILGDLATVTPANEMEGNIAFGANPNEDAMAVLAFARNSRPDSSFTDFPKLMLGNRSTDIAQQFKSTYSNSNNNNIDSDDQMGYHCRENDTSGLMQSRNDERPHWTLRYTLRSHWDTVRTISFHPDTYASLISGGDDGSLMMWSMEPDAINASAIARNWLTTIPSTTVAESTGDDGHFKLSGSDLLPTHVIRAHDGPVLSSLMFNFYSGAAPLACSGGLDGSMSVWLLPRGAWIPYENETLKEDAECSQFSDLPATSPSRLTTVTDHGDAVWGLSSVSISNEEILIASAGAEGVVKLWSLRAGENGTDDDIRLGCRHSFSFSQDWNLSPDDSPTSVAFTAGGTRLVIGSKSGTIMIVDTQTLQLLFSQSALSEGDDSRVYTVAAHESSPLAIAGLENGHLCFLDTQSASIIQNTVAHQQTVSSIAFEPQGTYFATASHDQSLRLWDVNSRSCVQEMHAHRSKFDESSLAVAFHSRLPLMASAGADAIVNVYSSAFSFSSTI